MRALHKDLCAICQCEFRSRNRRACCSSACDKVRQRRRRNGDLSAMSSSTQHLIRAAEQAKKHDRDCQGWLHQEIAKWYTERFNERVAQGCRPPIPLAVVLASHDQGVMACLPGRVMRIVAVFEDVPGRWDDDSEDEEDVL